MGVWTGETRRFDRNRRSARSTDSEGRPGRPLRTPLDTVIDACTNIYENVPCGTFVQNRIDDRFSKLSAPPRKSRDLNRVSNPQPLRLLRDKCAPSWHIVSPAAMAKIVEASPMKSAAEELELLRKTLRRCVDAYASRLESQIAEVRNRILPHIDDQNIPAARIRDLRDILTLCRTLEVRADKARRKDLKKIEAVIDELQVLVENW